MMNVTLFTLFLSIISARAFVLPTRPMKLSPRLSMSKTQLSEMDSMCILNTANYCVDNECPVDDVSALLNQLEDQRDLLAQQLETLDQFLDKMGVENERSVKQRDVNQLRDFMKGIAGIFGSNDTMEP